MKFHEFGNRANPHIMMIHGGGNAWWNYLRQARALSEDYHVILPTLDGPWGGTSYRICVYDGQRAKADLIHRRKLRRTSFYALWSIFRRTDRDRNAFS